MRKRLALVICLAAALAGLSHGSALAAGRPPAGNLDGNALAGWSPEPAPRTAGTSAAASVDWTMYGAGWGHGVGLSQWGAYGLAQSGWGRTRILTHYYRGTTVGRAPSGVTPGVIRVGLVWDRSCCTLTALGGPVTLRLGSPTNPDRYKIPNGYTWTVRPSNGHFQLRNAKGQVVATKGGPKWPLFAIYRRWHSRLKVGEFGHSISRGYVEMNVYQPSGGSSWYVRAIGVLGPQDYLYGLAEVPSTWPLAAMESQADAARTYAFQVIATQGQHRTAHGNCNCGIYANTIDQAWWGYDKELQGQGWLDAVRATNGEVILYGGRLISANYGASSGGYTEDNDRVWYTDPLPYLRAVCDPGDYVSQNPSRTWSSSQSASQISTSLARYGYDVGTVTGFSSIQRTPKGGRLVSVVVHGTGGSDGKSVTVSGGAFSSILGLRDNKVYIGRDLLVTGLVRARYDALRCRPGSPTTPKLSVPGGTVQRFEHGAIYVAAGQGSRAVWSHGPIYHHYVQIHGTKSVVGFPVSGIVAVHDGAACQKAHACVREKFTSGRMYRKESVGAHELHGAVLAYYLAHGGTGGSLGFPTSDVTKAGDGSTSASFEHGRVKCAAGPPSWAARTGSARRRCAARGAPGTRSPAPRGA
jgi:SpoIID/LytB domain protein